MKSNPFLKQTLGVVLSTLLLISPSFVGCGAFQDNNSQPSIEAIADQTLNVGDKTTVEAIINDADLDDTHAIRAFSDDTTIVSISVSHTTLTIEAVVTGTATITVLAIDDSEQDNASATPAEFRVTVKSPWVGTWAIEAVDGQSFEQTLEEDFEEEGVIGSLITNNYTFNSDGTIEIEIAVKIEARAGGSGFSEQGSIKMTGTYALSGSNYTLTLTRIEGTGIFEDIQSGDSTDEATGTWSRKGNTLTLTSDDGTTTVFRKK